MSDRKVLFIPENDIKSVLSMKETIALMRDAFSQISQGKVTTPLRTNINIPDHDAGALFMPVHSSENDLIGLKMVTLFKNNPQAGYPLIHALIILMDGKNGKPLAVMDGEFITALRTGAASGLASDLLSRPDARILGVIGAGVQGRTQMSEAGDIIIPIREKLIQDNHIHAELGEIVTGRKTGRSDESDITVFKSVGNAAQDLITAGEIFKKANQLTIGTFVSL